jgi:hypothetical protein
MATALDPDFTPRDPILRPSKYRLKITEDEKQLRIDAAQITKANRSAARKKSHETRKRKAQERQNLQLPTVQVIIQLPSTRSEFERQEQQDRLDPDEEVQDSRGNHSENEGDGNGSMAKSASGDGSSGDKQGQLSDDIIFDDDIQEITAGAQSQHSPKDSSEQRSARSPEVGSSELLPESQPEHLSGPDLAERKMKARVWLEDARMRCYNNRQHFESLDEEYQAAWLKRKEAVGELSMTSSAFEEKFWGEWNDRNFLMIDTEGDYRKALSEASRFGEIHSASAWSRFPDPDPAQNGESIHQQVLVDMRFTDMKRVNGWLDSVSSEVVSDPNDAKHAAAEPTGSEGNPKSYIYEGCFDPDLTMALWDHRRKIEGWNYVSQRLWKAMLEEQKAPDPGRGFDEDDTPADAESDAAARKVVERNASVDTLSKDALDFAKYLKQKHDHWIERNDDGSGYPINPLQKRRRGSDF